MKIWQLILICILTALIVKTCTGQANAAESSKFLEVSGFYGKEIILTNHPPQYDYSTKSVHIKYGRSQTDRLDIYIEGIIGEFKFKDKRGLNDMSTTTASASIMGRYDIVRYRNYKLFAEAGVGLGIRGDSPHYKLLGPNPTGLINAGLGIKIPLGKETYMIPQYRFTHSSSLLHSDCGINNQGIMFSIGKQW